MFNESLMGGCFRWFGEIIGGRSRLVVAFVWQFFLEGNWMKRRVKVEGWRSGKKCSSVGGEFFFLMSTVVRIRYNSFLECSYIISK